MHGFNVWNYDARVVVIATVASVFSEYFSALHFFEKEVIEEPFRLNDCLKHI